MTPQDMQQKQWDDLKRHWQGINDRRAGSSSAIPHVSSGMNSHLQKLMRSYRVLAVLSGAYTLIGPLSMSHFEMPLWSLVYIGAFFIVMFLGSMFILGRLASLDFGRMNTVELLRHVDGIIRWRLIIKVIGWVSMMPLLVVMFHAFVSVGLWVVYGGVCGLVLGLAIGLYQDMNMRRHLKSIRNELMECYG